MAEITKQANFRLNSDHVDIISKLAMAGRMTKASVVERALELLERRVAEGEQIPDTPPSPNTRQANFRLRVRHVEIINTLADSQRVTKATVVERALELLDAEMSGGVSSQANPQNSASRTGSIPTGAVIGNTAVDLSVVQPQQTQQAQVLPVSTPLHEVRQAASLDPSPAPAAPAQSISAPTQSVPAPTTAPDPEVQARKQAREEARRKDREASRERMRAEAEAKADKKAQRAIDDMRVSLRQEAYKQAEADAQSRIEAARVQAEANAQATIEARLEQERAKVRAELQADAERRIQEARNQAQAHAQANIEVQNAKVEAQASAIEARLNAQIDSLRQGLADRDAQIANLREKLSEGREARRDEKLESLMNQIAENERRREQAGPAHMAPVADPRIDTIMRQLEDQKESSKETRRDDRMEALIGRLEQTLRDNSGQNSSERASSSDEIVKILQALNIAGPNANGGVTNEELSRRVNDAREAGREEGLRQGRSESEALAETARREGYEAGQRDAQLTLATDLEEARTEGAYRERAKIANMRGWVFGEKRRYLKVHVTM